jgi:DNA-binding winged helix-turn-helix (wHTH) protein/Tol biopolymer transport system component
MNSGTQELPDSVTQQSGNKGLVQFGVFELNMQTGELRKSGVRIRLQGKPFQILQALLEHPGEVVTRDELRKRLWPADTFVDFESGLNTAANRLRLTLGDSAENPRYIQTLSRTGYRFIASVSEAAPRPESRPEIDLVAEPAPAPVNGPAAVVTPPLAAPKPLSRWWIVAGIAALLILIEGVIHLTRRSPQIEPAFRQITFRRGYVDLARFAPDGQTVLYGACWNGEPAAISMVSPGSPESRSLGFSGYSLMSVAKSGELILARKRSTYRVPMNGGSPKLFMEGVSGTDWMPQGQVALVRPDAGLARVEFPPGRAVFQTAGYISHLRVSPSGDAVAFLEHPMAADDGGNVVWVDSSGTPHHVSDGWASEAGLAWSPDGKEIWFTASRTGVNRALYAATRSGSVRLVASIPGTMTLHDISRQGQVLVSRDTLRLVMWMGAAGQDREKETDISWFDWSQPEEISPDGRYLLFTEGGEGGGREYGVYIRDLVGGTTTKLSDGEALAFLPDGKSVLTMMPRENTHLNVVPVGAGQPRTIEGNGFAYQWALPFPDGRKLLVVGGMPGKSVRLYTQSIDGGPLTLLTPEIFLDFPKISPDGTRIAGATRNRKIAVIPATGGTPEFLPIDMMHIAVKWSNDGNRLMIRAADHEGETLLEWLDLKTGKTTPWRKLRNPDGENMGIGNASVSQDEKTYVYASKREISELFVVDGWK